MAIPILQFGRQTVHSEMFLESSDTQPPVIRHDKMIVPLDEVQAIIEDPDQQPLIMPGLGAVETSRKRVDSSTPGRLAVEGTLLGTGESFKAIIKAESRTQRLVRVLSRKPEMVTIFNTMPNLKEEITPTWLKHFPPRY